jgi:hypothetical protein
MQEVSVPKDQTDGGLASSDLNKWEKLASSWGFSNLLTPEDGFRTCLNENGPWSRADQPGIYFWIAHDGEAYVGQSINPQARLREHWRYHRDLVRASFMPCPADDLDRVEARFIKEAGARYALRNIKLAVSTAREVPFDKAIAEEERERFLKGEELADGPPRDFLLLEQLQKRKFERFLATPRGADGIRALQTFVRRAIPKPAETEVGFWSSTIKPESCFIRVNAGQQEVFTYDGSEARPTVRVLTDRRMGILRSWRSPYAVQSYIIDLRADRLDEWLTQERLMSCRRLVVRLMRHTVALNSGSHCPQAWRHDLG